MRGLSRFVSNAGRKSIGWHCQLIGLVLMALIVSEDAIAIGTTTRWPAILRACERREASERGRACDPAHCALPNPTGVDVGGGRLPVEDQFVSRLLLQQAREDCRRLTERLNCDEFRRDLEQKPEELARLRRCDDDGVCAYARSITSASHVPNGAYLCGQRVLQMAVDAVMAPVRALRSASECYSDLDGKVALLGEGPWLRGIPPERRRRMVARMTCAQVSEHRARQIEAYIRRNRLTTEGFRRDLQRDGSLSSEQIDAVVNSVSGLSRQEIGDAVAKAWDDFSRRFETSACFNPEVQARLFCEVVVLGSSGTVSTVIAARLAQITGSSRFVARLNEPRAPPLATAGAGADAEVIGNVASSSRRGGDRELERRSAANEADRNAKFEPNDRASAGIAPTEDLSPRVARIREEVQRSILEATTPEQRRRLGELLEEMYQIRLETVGAAELRRLGELNDETLKLAQQILASKGIRSEISAGEPFRPPLRIDDELWRLRERELTTSAIVGDLEHRQRQLQRWIRHGEWIITRNPRAIQTLDEDIRRLSDRIDSTRRRLLELERRTAGGDGVRTPEDLQIAREDLASLSSDRTQMLERREDLRAALETSRVELLLNRDRLPELNEELQRARRDHQELTVALREREAQVDRELQEETRTRRTRYETLRGEGNDEGPRFDLLRDPIDGIDHAAFNPILRITEVPEDMRFLRSLMERNPVELVLDPNRLLNTQANSRVTRGTHGMPAVYSIPIQYILEPRRPNFGATGTGLHETGHINASTRLHQPSPSVRSVETPYQIELLADPGRSLSRDGRYGGFLNLEELREHARDRARAYSPVAPRVELTPDGRAALVNPEYQAFHAAEYERSVSESALAALDSMERTLNSNAASALRFNLRGPDSNGPSHVEIPIERDGVPLGTATVYLVNLTQANAGQKMEILRSYLQRVRQNATQHLESASNYLSQNRRPTTRLIPLE